MTEPASPAELGALVGPEWRLVRIERASGRTVTPKPGESYTIVFGAEGRYSGQADCNRYGGDFEAEPGDRLVLEPGLTSLAACAPPSS